MFDLQKRSQVEHANPGDFTRWSFWMTDIALLHSALDFSVSKQSKVGIDAARLRAGQLFERIDKKDA
jgi:hypothetical protein